MSEHGLLFDAAVYLGAAVVFVSIAGRIGLGSVLGYLAAGCVIGPFGLGLVQDVESILHFAEFGVVLMLFMIGLELEPERLWSMRRAVFGGGALQMAACFVPLAAFGAWAGLPVRGALVAGAALALSSTAIAIQTMREQHLLATPLGRTSFSILLFQDIIAIPIIGLVPLLAESDLESGAGGLGVLKVLGAIAAVVVIGRYLTRPLMRIVARTHMREVFTASALFLVIGISLLMAMAGISMALGAFLAGVLLASSEYRHALETDIEPFKGLLMGLFFIAVGMSIDFGLLAREPLLIATFVVGLMVVKVVALRVLAGPFAVASRERWLFAALLGQAGEFAFVVFGVARSARLLPGEWDGILTLVVALSMALTPLFVILAQRFAARRPVEIREADPIVSDAKVIIAGFGRFGQIVGRMLFASRIKATVLDHDPHQVDLLRKWGFPVFYGDATRIDLLEAAGAGDAQLLVVAIDDVEASLRLVELVREHFPRLPIVVRARNATHYLELRARGVDDIERETFESSLRAGRRALELLGVGRYEARERADRFREHNVDGLEALVPFHADEARRLSMAIAAREELELQFARDRAILETSSESGWTGDAESHPDRPYLEVRGTAGRRTTGGEARVEPRADSSADRGRPSG